MERGRIAGVRLWRIGGLAVLLAAAMLACTACGSTSGTSAGSASTSRPTSDSTVTSVPSSQGEQFTCEASGVAYTIPVGWSQEESSTETKDYLLASYMLYPGNRNDGAISYAAETDFAEDGVQKMLSSFEADGYGYEGQVDLGENSYWKLTTDDSDEGIHDELLMHIEGSVLHVFVFMGERDSPNLEANLADFETLVASATYAGTASSGAAGDDSSVSGTNPSIPDGAISWDEAGSYVGQTVTVYGPVASTRYVSSSNGEPTYINIGADYPDDNRLQVVIWGEDRARFSSAPESAYKGETIAVTGTLETYQGVLEIEVSSPSQIEVL